ncbi:MAG TPA: TIGR04442 family protein [Thermodesulfovibrionales bacterium]|nr:TIGR04442 family protein [Thermodesulfovibrionales bacterium]
MVQDLMLHGNIGPIEFLVFVAGAHVSNTYFYEETDESIRFFSRGNELTLSPEGVHYRGTGGSFCEYMFGVEKPFKDLIKKEVLNRLVMFGAFLDANERLVFTNDTIGSESFQRLFLLGHAVKNYYLLISSDDKSEQKKRQRQILRSVGKFLKRTTLVTEDKDAELLNGLVRALDEPRSTVFLFKLINAENRQFCRDFQTFYSQKRTLLPEEETHLNAIAAKYNIHDYQQERMKIDTMYRHQENRSIVDEYRDILLDIARKDTAQDSELAKLRRLRTLSIRNDIPGILFDTLDDFLLKDKAVPSSDEPEYLKESRAILENLFFKSPSLKRHIIKEDIAKLLVAKHIAHSQSDMGFERVLLDIGRACDEFARENNDFSIFEELSSIITYFDRYDNIHSAMSKIAFMEHLELTEDSLRSLVGNRKEFDALDKNLFKGIFINELLANKYLTVFGKKRVRTLHDGIEKVLRGDSSLRDLVFELYRISEEERVYKYIRSLLKDRIHEIYTSLNIKEDMTRIRNEIESELVSEGTPWDVRENLFDKVLLDLKKESYYLNHLLPLIIRDRDPSLREDFLTNSGLDRFYIEGLERKYLMDGGFDPSVIEAIKEEREFSGAGGGERI